MAGGIMGHLDCLQRVQKRLSQLRTPRLLPIHRATSELSMTCSAVSQASAKIRFVSAIVAGIFVMGQ